MIESKMVLVQQGTFEMGGESDYPNSEPIHPVTLSSYYIGQFTVTQKEWEAIMGSNPSDIQGDNLPVTHVSWNDVQEFIQKLNIQTGKQYRLPTEAEWEYAARGGNQSNGFEYAGSNNIDDVAWYCNNCKNLQPIGLKKPNELSLYDMSGNVEEWCQDWYGEYPSTPQVNPKGPDRGSDRVIRGGTWYNSPQYCRVVVRSDDFPGYRGYSLSFRLAHDFETFKNK